MSSATMGPGPAGVLELQRTAGNQAVTQALTNPAVASPLPVQRHEMRQESVQAGFAVKGALFFRDPMHKKSTGEDYAKFLVGEVKKVLTDLGCELPTFTYVNDPGSSTQGSFSRGTWTLEINTAAFGSDMETLSDADAAEAADTVYHEARHCNQYFRICRMLAGQKKSVKSIVKQSGIPVNVVKKAAENPLKEATAPAGMMTETKDWYNFTLGDDKTYKEHCSEARGMTGAARNALATDPFTDAEKQTVESLVGFLHHQTRKVLAKEKKRVEKIKAGKRTPGQVAELTHLENMMGTGKLVQDVLDAWQAAPDNDLAAYKAAMVGSVRALHAELFAAYMDYPHEKDAFATAGTVKNAFATFASIMGWVI